MNYFAGKSVLVTGAGGSIGSQICEVIAGQGAKRLTLVSLTENGLYLIDRHLRSKYPDVKVNPVLGSVGDECLISRAMIGVDSVIHAAAHKHVPMCEQNPVEAIRNNVFGTLTLARTARAAGITSFCLISSDKAVQPKSIMGATKRAAELIVRDMGYMAVRFGNVLDSAGSVLPLWREQIRAGGPITLTDARCERYFMSIPDAVGLVLSVIERGEAGTYVLDMGAPRKLVDMAAGLMAELQIVVPIEYIGLRPGEKLTEELYHGGALEPTDIPRVLRVEDEAEPPDEYDLGWLEESCNICDREGAVKILWDMVS